MPPPGFISASAPPTSAAPFALIAAAGGLPALGLADLLRPAVARRERLIVVIGARLPPDRGVTARLAGPFACGRASPSATATAPPPAPVGPLLFVEWPLGRFGFGCRPVVHEVIGRFGAEVCVGRSGIVAEAGRNGRVLAVAPSTAAATAATLPTPAPRASLAARFGSGAAWLSTLAPAVAFIRVAT